MESILLGGSIALFVILSIYFKQEAKEHGIKSLGEGYKKQLADLPIVFQIVFLILSVGLITTGASSIKSTKSASSTINSLEDVNSSFDQKKSNTNSVRSATCNICGRTFTGNGYVEVSEGNWQLSKEPYLTSICSRACGMKHTRDINNLMNKTNQISSSRCSNCGLGFYNNGFCNYCGAASAARVNESRSKLPRCGLCDGTGIEMGRRGEGGRICPMCDGTGRRGY